MLSLTEAYGNGMGRSNCCGIAGVKVRTALLLCLRWAVCCDALRPHQMRFPELFDEMDGDIDKVAARVAADYMDGLTWVLRWAANLVGKPVQIRLLSHACQVKQLCCKQLLAGKSLAVAKAADAQKFGQRLLNCGF